MFENELFSYRFTLQNILRVIRSIDPTANDIPLSLCDSNESVAKRAIVMCLLTRIHQIREAGTAEAQLVTIHIQTNEMKWKQRKNERKKTNKFYHYQRKNKRKVSIWKLTKQRRSAAICVIPYVLCKTLVTIGVLHVGHVMLTGWLGRMTKFIYMNNNCLTITIEILLTIFLPFTSNWQPVVNC